MNSLSEDDLYIVLGVPSGADAKTLRAAYLEKIREHPPERDAEQFERIRDAYRILSDPKRNMRRFFKPDDIQRPLRELAPESGACQGRAFLGVDSWREFLAHAGSRQRKERGGVQ